MATQVFLTGFMGAGKSTVGALLASRLGWAFVDLDSEIERAVGLTIAEIFAERGEGAFRVLEREALAALADKESSVVATGGGLPTDPAKRRHMRVSGRIVWLDVGFEEAWERVRGTAAVRPLAADRAAVRRLYEARRPAYGDCDIRVRCDGREPEAIAEEIALLLRGER